MKLTTPLRHMEFGNLGVYVRGLVTYSVSPYHLKAFHITYEGLVSALRRCTFAALHTVPFGAFAWWLKGNVDKKYVEMCRKDPNDYVNDK